MLESLHAAYPGVVSMEMETFQLLALANASTPQVNPPHRGPKLDQQEMKRPSATPHGPSHNSAALM